MGVCIVMVEGSRVECLLGCNVSVTVNNGSSKGIGGERQA